MSADLRRARTAGILYLATFATSIPALALKQPYLDGATSDPAAALGAAALEILLALACVGTAVALYPILRRLSPVLALAFVASRIVEAAVILLGVSSLVGLTRLGDAGEADEAARAALTALHDGAFLIGPGFLPVLNALLLASVLLRFRLVPRILPIVGLIGAPLLLISSSATLLGLLDQVSALAAAAALPIALWELGVGLWLTVRGVRWREPAGAESFDSPTAVSGAVSGD